MPSRTTMPADQRRQPSSLEARARHLERVFARLFSEDCPEGHRRHFFLSLAEEMPNLAVGEDVLEVPQCPLEQAKGAAPMKAARASTHLTATTPKSRVRTPVPA